MGSACRCSCSEGGGGRWGVGLVLHFLGIFGVLGLGAGLGCTALIFVHSLFFSFVFLFLFLFLFLFPFCFCFVSLARAQCPRRKTLDVVQNWCIIISMVELVVRCLSYQSVHAAYEGDGCSCCCCCCCRCCCCRRRCCCFYDFFNTMSSNSTLPLHHLPSGIGLLDVSLNTLSFVGLFADQFFPNITIFRLFKFFR